MVFHIKQSIKRLNAEKEAREKAKADAERIAALEDAMCEIDEANAERFAAIEDALCDIDAGAGA